MSYAFELVCELPASPQAVYDAWLSSAGHSAMTGAKAKASKTIGAAYSAWDGYIVGRNLELAPGQRIVQSWRASDFAAADPDSTITVVLTPSGDGNPLVVEPQRRPRRPDRLPGGRLAGLLFRTDESLFRASGERTALTAALNG